MRILYRMLRYLKDRYGDGKEALPPEIAAALERFVKRSHAIRDALLARTVQEQAEAEGRRRDAR